MLEPWELMSVAKDILGVPALGRMFGVGHMQIYRQMRNPDFTEDFIRSPIKRIRVLVCELDQRGERELFEGILN